MVLLRQPSDIRKISFDQSSHIRRKYLDGDRQQHHAKELPYREQPRIT
jgi:hypothetical protein